MTCQAKSSRLPVRALSATDNAIVFASDLHLSAADPDKVELFDAFMARASSAARQVFLLGDVFEIWLGDDDDSAPHPQILSALRRYTASGGELYVMRGNRDFLFSETFATATGARLLDDWHTIELFGQRTLLTHGDLLCTRDVQYQQFRHYVRNPDNQREFLAHPLAKRREIAAHTRSGTKASMLEKEDVIMDVEQSTVENVMREFDAARLIHGHTHRPADHRFNGDDGSARERLVLGDWYDECSVLVARDERLQRMSAASFVNDSGAPERD